MHAGENDTDAVDYDLIVISGTAGGLSVAMSMLAVSYTHLTLPTKA